VIARCLEQIHPAGLEVIRVKDRRAHEPSEQPLAFSQADIAEIVAVQPKQVESIVVLRHSPAHQFIESRFALRIKIDISPSSTAWAGIAAPMAAQSLGKPL